MTNYEIGRRKEYRCMGILKKQGAIWLRRSYGSHGIFDVTAVFPDKTLLIQVKSNYMSKQEYAILAEFAKRIKADNIHVEIWRFRKPRAKPEITRLK